MTAAMSEMAFDLSALSTMQRIPMLQAIRRCDFDFQRCLPRLKAEQGRTAIPISFEDLSRFGVSADAEKHEHSHSNAGGTDYHVISMRQRVLGLAYYSGKIVLGAGLENEPGLVQEVFLAEAAHMVDFFVTTPEQRQAIFTLFHHGDTTPQDHGWFEETGNEDYWSWVGEAWMCGFTQAYTDVEPSSVNFIHRLTEQEAQGIKVILDPVVPPVLPPPIVLPPVDPPKVLPFFASKKGHTFHDDHKGVSKDRWFMSAAEARSAGLTPCSTCKPK